MNRHWVNEKSQIPAFMRKWNWELFAANWDMCIAIRNESITWLQECKDKVERISKLREEWRRAISELT